jgi:hypothetical protein
MPPDPSGSHARNNSKRERRQKDAVHLTLTKDSQILGNVTTSRPIRIP